MAITITQSGTYTVEPGETYIIAPGMEGEVKFVSDGIDPAPIDFNIALNDSPSHTGSVKITVYSEDLSPTLTIADGYDGPKTEFDLKKAIDTEIISGENVVIDRLEASEKGEDIATFKSLDRVELQELDYLELDGNSQDSSDPSSLDCLNFDTSWMTDAERAALDQAFIDEGYISDGQGGWALPAGQDDGKVEIYMDLDGDGHDDFKLKLHHWEKINTVVAEDPDGVVDGEATGEVMELGYDDSNAPTDQGGDIITNGDDTIFGNGGNDTINGEGGDDLIYGDTGEVFGTFEGPRESFNWDLVSSSEADSTVQQDTGDVVVTYTRLQDTGSHESDVDNATNLNTSGIDSGSEIIDTNSSLYSETNVEGSVGEFQWEFSEPVGNLEFNINDLDGDGLVTVTAFDADDNPVEVVLTGGSDIVVTDNVADAVGPYQDVNDPDTTVQVSIAGPVSRIVVEHTQDGGNNSGINITDMYFDTGFVPVDGAGGNDVITGGAGADTMFGEGGDDTFIVATASDADGDVIDGGNGPDGAADNDVLDLRGAGQVTIVEAADPNDAGATAGTVTFANGEVLTFEGIETILTDPQPDGIVDGEEFAENMGLGYDDSNAPTDGGGDLITSGADSIEGNGGDDTINGAGGNDTIDGGTGDDFITGGAGDDSVLGADGSDTLVGGRGNDTLLGGDGDDDIVVGGSDSAEGGIGDDEFRVDGTDSAPDINATIDGGSDGTQPGDAAGPENGDAGDILNLGSQSNDLTVDLTDNTDPESGTVDGLDTIAGDDDLTFEEIERIITGSGDDTVDGTGTTGPLDVTTGGGNDSVLGSEGDDSVDAGPGNDTVTTGDGSDTVDGGTGDNLIDTSGNIVTDPITGLSGSGTPDVGFPGYGPVPAIAPDADPNDDRDLVTTGFGNDTITTGDDADTINAGGGDNLIDAGIDDDEINTLFGADTIVGGEGNDTISSGAGDDLIYGGLEPDPLLPDGTNIPDAPDGGSFGPDPEENNGKDLIQAGAGNDTVFGQDDDDTIFGGGGNDVLDGGVDDDSIEGGSGIDIIIGGQGEDTLLGGDDTDLIVGGDDDDSILGGNGVDILDGEAGNDYVDGGADTDLILGEDGNDTLIGSEGEDLVLGGTENDLIYGDDTLNEGNNAGGAADILFGEDGDDTIIGGAGDDLIDGGEGADSLSGGDDRDTFIEVGPGDVIDGGEGGDDFDTIVLSGPALIDYDPVNPENGTITFIDLATQTPIGTATFTNIEDVTFVQPEAHPPLVENDENSDPNVDPLDVVISYDAPDTPDASPPPPAGAPEGHVDGTSGADAMGFDPAYVDVDGDAMDSGDAILTGEVGDDDIVRAYGGNDTIFSGLGNDEVFAGEGNDQVQAGDGNDVVRGQEGNDTLAGGDGNDRMRGDDGNDLLFGQAGNDQLEGGDGDDTLDGGANDDVLFAGDGNDSLVGGTGNNIMLGGAGNDTFDGGNNPGIDDVYGENDADLFVGFGAGDTINGGSGGVDNDTLDLSGSGAFVLVENDGVTPLDLSTPNDADGNSFSGQVNFLDAGGAVTGTLTFSEIENIIPCFTPGTLIATPTGERLVEDLREGDRIITRDNGLQQIRWVGRRDLSGHDLAGAPHLQPVLIRAGSLGHGLPERDMMVSPQHRMLINNDHTALYFEDREVLAAAKHLTQMNGVDRVAASGVSYIHFMFDQHEVVLSNGAWTESFQPGETVLDAMGEGPRSEIYEIFPELAETTGREAYTAARRSLKKHEAKLLVS